jgi:hypothetical protein
VETRYKQFNGEMVVFKGTLFMHFQDIITPTW